MPLPALIGEVGLDTALYQEFTAYRGIAWTRRVKLWDDEERTAPLLMQGLTFKLFIGGDFTLISGAGIVVHEGPSELALSLSPEQTAAASEDQMRFYLLIEESGVPKVCPLHGVFSFVNP